jgi:hypothetical protein
MTTSKISYATAAAITCTLASITSGQGRRSAAVDNSANLYDDILVHVSVTPGTISAGAYIQVMAYASADDGTTYETQGSTDAAYNTLNGSEKILGTIIPVASTTQCTGVFSLAVAYGGVLPRNWGIIIWQSNCGTLSATEANHAKKYQGVTYTQT